MKLFDINKKYKISKSGNIFSNKSKRIVNGAINGAGYRTVYIGRPEKVLVHRIMAELFLGAEGKFSVNHINGIKTDNRLENLEVFKNYRDQILHSRNTLRNRGKYLTVDQVIEIIKERSLGSPVKDISKKFGLCRHAVSGICTGRYWPSEDYPDIKTARKKYKFNIKNKAFIRYT